MGAPTNRFAGSFFLKGLYYTDRVLRAVSADRSRIVPYWLYAQPVPTADEANSRSARARNWGRWVDEPAELPEDQPRPPAVIARRFSQGSTCLLKENDDGLVGFLWLHLGPYPEDEVRAMFVPRPEALSAWDFDVYVAPRYRVSLAFARLWDAANAWMRDRGVLWCHSRVSMFNTNSMQVHERLGARRTGWLVFLLVGSLQLLVGRTDRWHLNVSFASTPTIDCPSPV